MNTITPKQINISRRQQNSTNVHPRKEVSFKGAPVSVIKHADDLMEVFSQHYGNIGHRIGKKVEKLVTAEDTSEILKKSSRFIQENGTLQIQDKGIARSLGENLVFPFVNLPLYGASWAIKQVQKIAPDGAKEGLEKLYKKPLLRVPRKLNELDAKTNQLKGIFEKTDDIVKKFAEKKDMKLEDVLALLTKKDITDEAEKKLVQEANEYIKEEYYKVSNKFFDKHTGNFNTAYERPLNRIVTGLIPVAFLANDAYNLSVMCGDDEKTSKKEAAERRSQEISRVFTTAYIQLLTFGAFAKQVNTLPWFTPLTSALTVLFSETSSRLRLGKPVFFLSKEKAKAHNQKEKEKEKIEAGKTDVAKPEKQAQATTSVKQDAPVVAQTPVQTTSYNQLSNTDSKVFTSFKAGKKEEAGKAGENKPEERKALINFETFKKGVIILVTGGFALSFLKNSSFTKNSAFMNMINEASEWCKKNIYNKLAFKDFEISKAEFEKVKATLDASGCGKIAEGHSYIAQKFSNGAFDDAENTVIKLFKGSVSKSKAQDIATSAVEEAKGKTSIIPPAEEIIQKLKTALGTDAEAELPIEELIKKLKEAVTPDAEAIKKDPSLEETANSLLKEIKKAIGIDSSKKLSIDDLFESLEVSLKTKSQKELSAEDLAETLKIAIGLENTAIAEMKYGKVAQKALDILRNKKLIVETADTKTLKATLTEAIKKNAEEKAIQVDTKLRPFVDIVTQPFKFIASAAKLPFKIVTTLINMATSKIEKKAAKALIGEAELSDFENAIHRVVKEIYGEKSGKEGKTCQTIFANAMEKLQKKTLPYRKAEEALNKAIKGGNESEIAAAREALKKAKNDLTIYVNTAVEKSFDGVTQSSNKNTDLAMMSKLASSAVTSAFLVADNYNMVMLKSDGEDKEGAKEKANERIIQRLSGLFYQTLFINWFNATFRSTYNSSLKGMAAVAIPNTITTELLTRSSIGMPIGRKSYEQLQELDRKNENRTGFAGKYFKFMRLLTGKKPLKDRLPKDKAGKVANTQTIVATNNSSKPSSTNLLEMHLKK